MPVCCQHPHFEGINNFFPGHVMFSGLFVHWPLFPFLSDLSLLLLKISVLHPPLPEKCKQIRTFTNFRFTVWYIQAQIIDLIGNIEHHPMAVEHLIARQIVKSDIPVGKQEKAKNKEKSGNIHKSGWLSSQLFYLFRAIETPRKHCAILKNQNLWMFLNT